LDGINDEDALMHGDKNFIAEKFEEDYRQLLQQTKQ
jgi:hypothetical protein